ncbi:MAG: hypothetical protein R6X02_12580 [Enhygromyxa sp.]
MASTLAGLLGAPTLLLGVPVGLAGAATLLSPAVAEAGVTSASCRIHAVEATPEGDGTIPKDLEFLSDQLQAPEFARYKGFRLIDVKDYKLDAGTAVEKKFKSGHVVKLSLLGGEQDKLDLHTEILRGAGSVASLDFLLKVAQLMLIPVRRGDQAIIFAYQCKN